MKVFVANCLENLIETLAQRLSKPLAGALTPETIVVQSAGMAKWVSLELASRHGVAANYRFPFPNLFMDEIFDAFLPGYTANPLFDERVLAWRIFDLLPERVANDEFRMIRHYLGEGGDQRKLHQLAEKIARAFDQYLIFRPDVILKWEEGKVSDESERWQASLWRRLSEKQAAGHRAALQKKLLAAMQYKPCRPDMLPRRLSIFGISYLPPYHLDIFVRLSDHVPVDYYYMNPSREFWADIKSKQEITRLTRKVQESRANVDDDLLHLEGGNSLLASWGAQGRDFFRLMEDMPVDYTDLFEEPRRDNLLKKVQSDIYHLREPHDEQSHLEEIPRNDDSIQIHACHSPLREVETLHDALLHIFNKDNTVAPRNVLVMTPDIESYAPLIEAVFEAREPKIPYTIADRSPLFSGVIASSLMSILDMAESRFKAGDVLALLENPAICEKFQIGQTDRELIHHWIDQTLIKWGLDEAHRRSFNLPSFGQNTWKHGLDRLLAGVMFDGRRHDLFSGILPYGEIESEQTVVLGRFLTFWETLVSFRDVLCRPHALGPWCGILKTILTNCFTVSDAYRNERYSIHQIISRLQEEQNLSGCGASIELSVIRSYLREAMGHSGGGARFLDGGVSFCAMLPMRSIPFDVICLLGMNADAYPRRDMNTGFNIMEAQKRPGDRSLRNDDQYLFLESILSARKKLVISYVGLSSQDNKETLPSVLVCEFLDYLKKNYREVKSDQPVSETIVRHHRLHPFSSAYFRDDERLYSYSLSNYRAAQAIAGGAVERKLFQKEALPEMESGDKVIPLPDLLRFYRDPAAYFLTHRLGMKLPGALWQEDPDSEPFGIDSLNAYQIKQAIVENRLQSAEAEMVFKIKRAEGVLPVGAAGDYLFGNVLTSASNFAKEVARCLKSPKMDKLNLSLSVGQESLIATIDDIRQHWKISYRPAKLKMKDYLSAWIEHLVLNAAAPKGYPTTSLLLGEEEIWQFEPLADAMEQLNVLIQYYRLGHTKPVKLFARSSWDYAKALWQSNKSQTIALAVAQAAWLKDEYNRNQADSENIACKICFGGIEPLDEEFQKTAENILKELFAHLKKTES